MDPELLARRRARFDELMDCISPAGGISVDDGMAALEPYIRQQDPLLITFLSGGLSGAFPPGETYVQPEISIENFEKIRSKERLWLLLENMPEEAEPDIQLFFDHLLKKALPSLRDGIEKSVSPLPHDPGGRPPKWPSEEICSKICDKISALHRDGVSKTNAQQRAADEYGLNLWMIRKIWGKRPRNN